MPTKPLIDANAWLTSMEGTPGCWIWPGKPGKNGYGRCTVDHVRQYVHRYAYISRIGPIPEGRELDHLCRNRMCARPNHLEAVPQPVNAQRSFSPFAVNARKTHCPKGHAYTPENTLRKGRHKTRTCRTCLREWKRADYERHRDAYIARSRRNYRANRPQRREQQANYKRRRRQTA